MQKIVREGVSPFQGFGTVGGILTQGVAAGLSTFAPLVRGEGRSREPNFAEATKGESRAGVDLNPASFYADSNDQFSASWRENCRMCSYNF
jgi:hypothetical protein